MHTAGAPRGTAAMCSASVSSASVSRCTATGSLEGAVPLEALPPKTIAMSTLSLSLVTTLIFSPLLSIYISSRGAAGAAAVVEDDVAADVDEDEAPGSLGLSIVSSGCSTGSIFISVSCPGSAAVVPDWGCIGAPGAAVVPDWGCSGGSTSASPPSAATLRRLGPCCSPFAAARSMFARCRSSDFRTRSAPLAVALSAVKILNLHASLCGIPVAPRRPA